MLLNADFFGQIQPFYGTLVHHGSMRDKLFEWYSLIRGDQGSR